MRKITSSSIKPEPSCTELQYIWNWRDFIIPKMTKKKLANHSFLHSFLIKKENGVALLRARKYPQDACDWLPKEGINLLLEDVDLVSKVPVAPIRIEKLNLDAVYMGVITKYIPYLPEEHHMQVSQSWERLKDRLEKLTNKQNFGIMTLQRLPKQQITLPSSLPHMLEPLQMVNERELVGSKHVADPETGCFESEIKVDMDVAIFTRVKSSRPWLGRVVSFSTGKDFTIRWFNRMHKSFTFCAAEKNGVPYTSTISIDSVMLWNFSEGKTNDRFEVSKELFSKIMKMYEEHDICYD